MPKQYRQLQMRPRLIVGTPGRVNDHLARRTLHLDTTRFLVLDETDRMLDMGFGVQLDAILTHLPTERQTMMFSATLPANIIKLSGKYLHQPQRVAVGSTIAVAPKIRQELIQTTDADKYGELMNQLEQNDGTVIVFVKTKFGADKLATKLCRADIKADAIHGDLKQSRRDRVIQDYRAKKFRVLVATDVAARGLDIPHIETVINYDMPQCPEDYIHRIGRTARAGAEGYAVNLVAPIDGAKWKAIHRLMNPDAAKEPRNDRSGGNRTGGNSRNAGGFGGRRANNGFGGQNSAPRPGGFPGYAPKQQDNHGRRSNDGYTDGAAPRNRFDEARPNPGRFNDNRNEGGFTEGRGDGRTDTGRPLHANTLARKPTGYRPGPNGPMQGQGSQSGQGGFKKPFGKPQGAAGGRRFAKKPNKFAA